MKTKQLKRGIALAHETWGDERLCAWLRALFRRGGHIVVVVGGRVLRLTAEKQENEHG